MGATAAAFAILGSIFAVLAAVGIIRMPDLFTRLQTATKASTLGVGCVMVAVAVQFGDLSTVARAVLVIAFLFVTAPVAAHAIGRAAYLRGVPLWDRSRVDELREHYRADEPTSASETDEQPEDAPVSAR